MFSCFAIVIDGKCVITVVPGGTSSGVKTVLRRMEEFMGSNDPMMPQPRYHSQPAEDNTTHI